ncbi:hypothetical protein F4W70_12010 [Pseudomonas cannabina]|nr:hypothetical protein F4W70_12010 [Pseudomonas cannabina]
MRTTITWETLIYSKTQLLPPDKSRPPERCRDEKSNKSAPPLVNVPDCTLGIAQRFKMTL